MWGATNVTAITAITINVSIHAPVWGATRKCQLPLYANMFQSTHPCGVRPSSELIADEWDEFQSTHPCGVRQQAEQALQDKIKVSIHAPVWGATPQARQYQDLYVGFNPRTRVGCDNKDFAMKLEPKVSIHAPVWGATLK